MKAKCSMHITRFYEHEESTPAVFHNLKDIHWPNAPLSKFNPKPTKHLSRTVLKLLNRLVVFPEPFLHQDHDDTKHSRDPGMVDWPQMTRKRRGNTFWTAALESTLLNIYRNSLKCFMGGKQVWETEKEKHIDEPKEKTNVIISSSFL